MYEATSKIIYWIYSIVGNYGWSIVLFTLLIRIICTPFDYKSRISMRKQQMLQPQLTALQKKYANDKDKLNRKMSELYKEQGVSPLSGCIPMLITLPLLWLMFGAMRIVANQHLVQQTFDILQGKEVVLEGWLWVKNVWMPDSPFAAVWPTYDALRMASDSNIWLNAFSACENLPAELALTADSFSKANLNNTIQVISDYLKTMDSYVEMTATMPGFPTLNFWIAQVNLLKHYNGFFLLPILSAVTQYIMTMLQPTAPSAGDSAQQASAQSTTNFMKWFFPLFSLWICSSYNAVFAIYWVASNVIGALQSWLLNKYMDRKLQSQTVKVEGNVK